MSTPVEDLCQGFSAEFSMYMNYCRELRFEETPDYMYLRQLFRNLFRTMDYSYDYAFDWTLSRQENTAVRINQVITQNGMPPSAEVTNVKRLQDTMTQLQC